MQNELKTLEELVENKLDPQRSEISLTSEALEKVLACVQTGIAQFKRTFSKGISNRADYKQAKHFVQTHQAGLIELLDTLSGIINFTANNLKNNKTSYKGDLVGVQKAVYIAIEDLLSYIGYRYSHFCNPNMRISEKYRRLFLRRVETEILEIEDSDLKVNPELIEIALAPVKKLLDNTNKRLTYFAVLFYKELLRVINDIKRIENKEEHENELIRALVFINFNSLYFGKYCVKKMKTGLEKRYEITDKIEFLALCLKRINQTPIRSGMALSKNYPSIKDLLSQWVLEEICFWERKHQLNVNFQKDNNYLIDTNMKIATGLSVPQLACFIRLLVEIGAITNKRKEDVLEFYPEFYQSKRVESIEYGSFRSKYYGIQEATKEHIRELLLRMLDKLREL